MPEQYIVRDGDCFLSIAADKGFAWKTLWNDPGNADLKQQRKDPTVLLPGDMVTIPDRKISPAPIATGKRTTFKRKGIPVKFRLRMLVDDKPRPSGPYRINIDGEWRAGQIDGDGYIKEKIPPYLKEATLIVGPPEAQETFTLEFGAVAPLETDQGVRTRLGNLGFDVTGDDLSGPISAFQEKIGLNPSGAVDDATRAKLKEKFGQ